MDSELQEYIQSIAVSGIDNQSILLLIDSFLKLHPYHKISIDEYISLLKSTQLSTTYSETLFFIILSKLQSFVEEITSSVYCEYMRCFTPFILNSSEEWVLPLFLHCCGIQVENNTNDSCFEVFLEIAINCCKQYDAVILQNLSSCLKEWLSTCISIEFRYELLFASFKELLHTTEFNSIAHVIGELFPHLLFLLNKLENSEQIVVHLQDFIFSYMNSSNINQQIEAMYMQQLFYQHTSLLSSISQVLPIVYKALYSENPSMQKYGMSLLLSTLHTVFSHYSSLPELASLSKPQQNQWLQESKKKWELYIHIYDTLNEYAAHLIKQIWDKIYLLVTPSSISSFLSLTNEWIELLYYRGLNHANPQVKLITLSSLFSSNHHQDYFIPSPSFISQTLIPTINQGVLFKGNLYGIGYALTAYLRWYILQLSNQSSQLQFIYSLLQSTLVSLTNPIALQFLLGVFDTAILPPKPTSFEDEVNASSTGTEAIHPEEICSLYDLTLLDWKGSFTQEFGLLFCNLYDKIRTQVSFLPLQNLFLHSLLHIFFHSLSLQPDSFSLALFNSFFSFIHSYPLTIIQSVWTSILAFFSPVQAILPSLFQSLYQDYYEKDGLDEALVFLWKLLHHYQLDNECKHYMIETTKQMNHKAICLANQFYHINQTCIEWSWISEIEQSVQSVQSVQLTKEYCDSIEYLLHHQSTIHLQLSIQPSSYQEKYYWIRLASLLPSQESFDFNQVLQWLIEINTSSLFSTQEKTELLSIFKDIVDRMSISDSYIESYIHTLLSLIERASKQQYTILFHLLNQQLASIKSSTLLQKVYEVLSNHYDEYPSDKQLFEVLYQIAQNSTIIQSYGYEIPSHYHLNQLIIQDILQHHSLFSSLYIPLFLRNCLQYPNLLMSFSKEFASLLLFKESKDEINSQHLESEHYLRTSLLVFIEQLQHTHIDKNHQDFFYSLILHLLTFSVEETSTGRHIQNSEDNGVKLRCWQALVILSKSLPVLQDQQKNQQIKDLYCQSILQLNLKDIRFYIELFGIQLIASDTSFFYTCLSLLHEPNQQAQAIPSLILVTSYSLLHKSIQEEENQSVFEEQQNAFIQAILPWMISPEGLIRTIAQFTGYEVLQRMTLHHSYYSSLLTMLQSNKRIETMRKKQQAVFKDFETYMDCSVSILLHNSINNLHDFVPKVLLDAVQVEMNSLFSVWYKEDYPCYFTQQAVEEKKEEITQFDNFQRKILPWEECSKQELEKRKKQDIILIATFVDKLPNLGGLTRTSEIFAVKKLVVSSLKVKKEQVFKSTSVTAEEWVDMEEVTEQQLPSYLRQLKKEGYSLVGLEQTVTSKLLGQVQLPKKMALVLGHEKEGIPIDIIQMLDLCVEIPQYGIIRSLNVHVSGSILLWEYISF